MKEVIEKAIEGGWKPSKTGVHNEPMYSIGLGIVMYRNLNGRDTQISFGEILIDPLFWQALSKAMGWSEKINYGEISIYEFKFPMVTIGWLYQWHRFIDVLAEGKSPDDFFNSLIS